MILIIDDDPEVLEILQSKIAATGDTLAIACETIEDALKIISAPPEDISVIYLDIYLPRVNGVDSVAIISNAIKDMIPKPLINSMSGDTSIRLKQAAIANGARKFFSKTDLLLSDESFRESLFFDDRRQPRGDDSRDWRKGIDRRIGVVEDTVKKLQELTNFSPDSMATQLARLQGEQITDGVRIEEIKQKQKEIEDNLEGVLGFIKFAKGFPGGYKAFLVSILLLVVALTMSGDRILYATGVDEALTGFGQKIFQRKGDR